MNIRKTLVLAMSMVLVAQYAQAVPVTFTIDPQLSTLDLSSYVPDFNLGSTPQGDMLVALGYPSSHAGYSTGGLSFYTGTINADVVPGSSIQFTGSSLIDANITDDGQGWAPDINNNPANVTVPTLTFASADYGFTFATIVWASLKDFQLDITSGSLALTGNNFPGTQTLTAIGGDLAYTDVINGGFVSPGNSSLIGLALANNAANGTLTQLGNNLTLTIPVSVSQPVDIDGTGVDLIVAGTLVATAVIPEPSTLLLAGMGAVGVGLLAARRRRRS
ncbi:MAG: PEP-CTERM sorting domain-containing protein [Pirellulales bacterium]|nr:PEP-CTERM sorting domain-containing protein [Pirellulales bacterium]